MSIVVQVPESWSDVGQCDSGSLSRQSVKPFIYFTGERQVSFFFQLKQFTFIAGQYLMAPQTCFW